MAKRLRIAQIAPVAEAVTGEQTGSIEQLVWLLTEELVRRGHEVTLAAVGESQTSAALHAIYPRGYESDPVLWSYEFHETMNAASIMEKADDFDVIHSHVYHFALPFIRLVRTPVIHSYHILPDPDIIQVFARYPEAYVVAISEYQRGLFPGNPRTVVVRHGVRTATFPVSEKRGDYLLFLGRLMPDKGTVEAIHLARAVGMRLVIAGPEDSRSPDYFPKRVEPLVDGRQVQYVGPVGLKERNDLLAGAAALVYPNQAPEPFGLVLVEAMACGTPILATGLGAVPELVRNGVTGYYAPNAAALAGRVEDALALDRQRIRQEAVERFDYQRMVDEYERIYYERAARSEGSLS